MNRRLVFEHRGRTLGALVLLSCIVIVFTTQWSSINRGILDIRSRVYLNRFGWNTTHLTGTYETAINEQHLENESLLNAQFQAAKRMGFDPQSIVGLRVKVYEYGLNQAGLTQPLSAEIWWEGGSIVSATICHGEPNLDVRFWPPNERLEDIRTELAELKVKAMKEGRLHP